MNKKKVIIVVFIIIGIIFYYKINFSNNARTYTNSNLVETTEDYIFEDTIAYEDTFNFPKGCIYIYFDPATCSKDEAYEIINSLNKKEYYGVSHDLHFFNMGSTNYQELYTICNELMTNNKIAIAYVDDKLFDNTISEEDIENWIGTGVIAVNLTPSGGTVRKEEFLDYISNYNGATYLGVCNDTHFLKFSYNDENKLQKISNDLINNNDNFLITSYILN